MDLFTTLLEIAGAASIVFGAFLIAAPAGFVMLGLALLAGRWWMEQP